jgi:sugar lactone lactonase YvrE
LIYWVNAITSGTLIQGDAALSIMAGALINTTEQGLIDGELINNRLAVASEFTAQVSTQNAVSTYAGTAAAASARNMLGSINATTATTGNNATVNAEITDLLASGIFLLAGNAGVPYDYGPGASVALNYPYAVAVDSAGNVYTADSTDTIRKITQTGVMTILAGTPGVKGSSDGTGAAASFNVPYALAVDSAGNVYVADCGNSTIRKVTPSGVVTTIAGKAGLPGFINGVGTAAQFDEPTGIAVDLSGNIYVADTQNSAIRKINSNGQVTTFASDFPSEIVGPNGMDYVSLSNQFGIATDTAGNVYVANTIYSVVVKITPTGIFSLVAGIPDHSGSTNGPSAQATFAYPSMLAVDNSGNIYVGDGNSGTIRKISTSGAVTSVAGQTGNSGYENGMGPVASFNYLKAVAVDSSGNVYAADAGNNAIREINTADEVSTFAGLSSRVGAVDGTGTAATFYNPSGLAVDASGNTYVSDTGNNLIRKITPAGVVTTMAGTGTAGSTDGLGVAASFDQPNGVAVDSSGNVYVADTGNKTIRMISPSGFVSTLAGTAGVSGSADGIGAAASFTSPYGVAVDPSGNVYVADVSTNTVRKIAPGGVVTTFAGTAGVLGTADGTGAAANFKFPTDIATDDAGNVYVSDQCVIRKITPYAVVTTLAGTPGVRGSTDGTGAAASFFYQTGLAVDTVGNVYVADGGNNAIRKITPAGVVTTVVGGPSNQSSSLIVLGHLPGAAIFNSSFIAIDAGSTLYITSSEAVLKIKLP